MSTERTCDLFCCKTITSTIHLSCIRRIGCGTAGGPPGSVRSAGSAGSATSFIVGAGYLPTCLLASLDPTATMAAGDFSFLFLFFLFLFLKSNQSDQVKNKSKRDKTMSTFYCVIGFFSQSTWNWGRKKLLELLQRD